MAQTVLITSKNSHFALLFQSPEKTRIFLDFPVFKVREQNGDCVDEVAVRQYLPGMRGTS